MPPENNERKSHIKLNTPASKNSYTSPKSGNSSEFRLAIRNLVAHGQNLRDQLNTVQEQGKILKTNRESVGIHGEYGFYIEFESEPSFELSYESLEDQRSGIEVENIRTDEGKTFVTVYVPEGKLVHFFKKVEDYLTKRTKKKGNPKNQKLLENISAIRLATLKSFWTDIDKLEDIPNNEIRWWEIWLRAGEDSIERETITQSFMDLSQIKGIEVSSQTIIFPERTVLLAKASKEQLSSSIIFLNCLAELRTPKDTVDFFMRRPQNEQREWSDELLSRTSFSTHDSPAVCLLDKGINNSHPLILPALSNSDRHSYDPSISADDHDGHGTELAGLALYSDLYDALLSTLPIILEHRLESVKMMKTSTDHSPDLYGDVTRHCISIVEVAAPTRKRVICLTILSKETRQRGVPSSWSSAVDQICGGFEEEDKPKRLLLMAAGNLDSLEEISQYPARNLVEGIHDPGQSWNAVTVGAYTEKTSIDQTVWPGFTPLAPLGGLCPSSTTSLTWEKKWPNKPDIVCEGGNYGIINGQADAIDSLQLLSSYYQPHIRLFSVTGDTSAATALASRIGAMIVSKYPELWPETIRGLLIHSANWTSQMLVGMDLRTANRDRKIELLRTYGYGVPNIDKALWSINNALTLITEESIIPFRLDGPTIKSNEINLHRLPLPTDLLNSLGGAEIELRITLSYYIEPNPTHRKYFGKFDYASHGLRFDLKRATETIDDFNKRINKISRDEDPDFESASESVNWLIGPTTRNHGSIHSDIWKGTAVELASMDTIAIYPITGWWRLRKKQNKWDSIARYSLLVSISTPDETVDIYTPIAQSIRSVVEVTT